MHHTYARLHDGGGMKARRRLPGTNQRHETARARNFCARAQGSGAGRAIDGEASHG